MSEISAPMRAMLFGTKLRFADIGNRTAKALEKRGLVEWGPACWGQHHGHWIITQAGMKLRAALTTTPESN